MASGGEYGLSSDEVYDFACSSCEEDNVNTEAQYSCKDCENYLCNKCIKLHDKLIKKKHAVLGRSDVAKWVGKGCETSLEKCEKHPDESVKMVCEDHDELCCSLCVSLTHRMCHSISLIDDIAKGIKKTDQLKKMTKKVKAINTEIITIKKQRLSNKKTLLQEFDRKLVQDIQTIRETLLASLQELENDIRAEKDIRKDQIEKKIQEDVTQCTEMHDKLNKTLGYTQSDDERLSYISYRRCQEQLDDAEKRLKKMSKIPEYKISLKIEKDLDHIFDSLKSIGKVVSTPGYDECDSKSEQIVHDAKPETSSTIKTRDDPNYAFTTKVTRTHNLRENEAESCCIKGICELQTGEIVLADSANDNIKVLNREFKIVKTFSLPKHTENMCLVGGYEIALAVDDHDKKHEVHFITIEKGITMKNVNKFAVAHGCNAVAFHSDNVYVGATSAVYLYSKNWKMIKKVYQASGWLGITLNGIHTSSNGQSIYITDSTNHKVITVDNSGEILATFEDPDLKFPISVCVSEYGHVFICALSKSSVLQIDKDGRRKLRTLVSGGKINQPYVVWFSTRSQQLLVAGKTNDLLVADLI